MALYRTYRPATFAEVKGQEHVTEPLSRALDSGRINHAYLFSGPRGCGKTSSARILARSLNCEHGPTSTPCGTCASCVALAPGGPGNLDVIELDAASHGGVDDTRDLRDRASFAPAESRYRVFIIDEAHMVTSAGFNALLKIVEEPPEHLIFIFATTEPDKVLTTIRSRTHHYPFRLLPPSVMRGLLESICDREQVTVAPEVFPLVIRAGGGSPRDSLSILDQLLAGAGEEGVVYERALALLGVTDGALIDATIDALAAADGPALFGAVEQVVEAGHDPRRFAVDLLDRIRDLILLQAVPDAAERGLVEAPGEQLTRMQTQIAQLGPATLTRYAELVHTALGEMRGTTSPRLLLEVLCARLLLPGVSADDTAVLTRIEALELRPGAPAAAVRPAPAPAPGAPAAAAPPLESDEAPKYVRPSQRKAAQEQSQAATQATSPEVQSPQAPAAAAPAPQAPAAPAAAPAHQVPTSEDAQAAPTAPPQVPVEPAAEPPVGAPVPQPPAAESQAPEAQPPTAAPSVPQAPAAPPQAPVAPGQPAQPQAPVASAPQAQQPAARRPADGPLEYQGVPLPDEPPDYDEIPPEDAGPPRRPAPEPTPAAPAAAEPGLTIDDIRRRWSDIVAGARSRSQVFSVILAEAVVHSVSDGAVVLGHKNEVLIGRLSEPARLAELRELFSQIFQRPLDVQVTLADGPAAAPATQPQGGPRGGAAPAARRPTFSRPSQAAGGPQGEAAAPPPEPEPEPEEPASPSGYEDFTDAERDEMLNQAKNATPDARLDPDKVALELLKNELGARPVD